MVGWKLSGDNGLERRQLLGANTTGVPSPESAIAVSLEVTIEYDSTTGDNVYADYLAQTAADATIIVTGTGNDVATFVLHNARITGHTMPVSSRGKLIQTLTLTGYGDGTDHGCKITVVNDNATAVTN